MFVRSAFSERILNLASNTLEKSRALKKAYSYLASHRQFVEFDHIEVETSSFCNRKCTYCPNIQFDKLNSSGSFLMDDTILSKILFDLSTISFNGTFSPHMYGEPLLEPRILKIISEIYSIGAKPKIYTNADFLTPSLLEEMISNGLHTLFVSKHSHTLGKDCKEALSILFSSINEFKGESLETICQRIEDREIIVKGLHFRIRDYYSDFCDNRSYIHNRGGSLDVITRKSESPIACQYVMYPVIDVEGNVVLCCNDYKGKHVLGNVLEKNLIDIWRDPNNVILRKRIYHGKLDLSICQECVL